ncbi:MAG: ABC transporter permease subunit [Candidatus Bathyarchaeia archaeon]
MGKGRPFLEVFASALNEDYRFPILEIFAFLYALGTFAIASGMTGVPQSGEAYVYGLINLLSGFPFFIFVILIFKNVAYGLGNDLEKGVIQTLLSYPLKRWKILTAKLLSALGISLLMFLGIQIFALFLLAPEAIATNANTVLLVYACQICQALFLSGIVLLLALLLKRGGLAIVVGIVLYFALGIVSSMALFVAYATGVDLPLKIYAVISPSIALQMYYMPFIEVWKPTFSEVLTYIGAGYLVVAIVFVLAYAYFERRLEI